MIKSLILSNKIIVPFLINLHHVNLNNINKEKIIYITISIYKLTIKWVHNHNKHLTNIVKDILLKMVNLHGILNFLLWSYNLLKAIN
jgi:hypothetical protein